MEEWRCRHGRTRAWVRGCVGAWVRGCVGACKCVQVSLISHCYLFFSFSFSFSSRSSPFSIYFTCLRRFRERAVCKTCCGSHTCTSLIEHQLQCCGQLSPRRRGRRHGKGFERLQGSTILDGMGWQINIKRINTEHVHVHVSTKYTN